MDIGYCLGSLNNVFLFVVYMHIGFDDEMKRKGERKQETQHKAHESHLSIKLIGVLIHSTILYLLLPFSCLE